MTASLAIQIKPNVFPVMRAVLSVLARFPLNVRLATQMLLFLLVSLSALARAVKAILCSWIRHALNATLLVKRV